MKRLGLVLMLLVSPSLLAHGRRKEDYGGNLVEYLYGVLRRPNEESGSIPEAFDRSLALLLGVEEWMLKYGRLIGFRSFHTVILAEPAVHELTKF